MLTHLRRTSVPHELAQRDARAELERPRVKLVDFIHVGLVVLRVGVILPPVTVLVAVS